MNKYIFTVVLLLLLVLSVKAQESNTSIQQTDYYYTVKLVDSEDQLSKVVTEFENLNFVSKVKLNYKPEKPTMAQFIVYVIEPKRTSEDQKMFEPIELKKILIKHGLEPYKLQIQEK